MLRLSLQEGMATMGTTPMGSRKRLMDRFTSPRHVGFWGIISGIATVIILVVTLTSNSSSSKPVPPISPAPAVSVSSAPEPSQTSNGATPTGPPSAAAGTPLMHYHVTVAVGYGINFGSTPSPPVNLANGSQADLEYQGGVYLAVGTSGQISEPSVASPSYQACLNDTAYATKVIAPPTGSIICFTGHGIVASALITNFVTEPVQSLTFDVTVWKQSG
jgi:hypothetical protein